MNNFSKNYIDLKEKTSDLSIYTLDELEKLLVDAKNIEKQYNNLQLVVKRNANSLYGVSASIYFSLVDVDVAEDITTTGKHYAIIVDKAINNVFVNWGEKELKIIQQFYPNVVKLRKFSEYKPDTENDLCVYGDTDSRYLDLGRIYNSLLITENDKPLGIPKSDEELANFGVFLDENFLRKVIKDTIDNDCEYRNARKGYLKMNHEITTRKVILQAKKKYIMTSIWENGKLLKQPKIKYKGVELKKGTSSPKMKKILSKLIDKFLIEDYSINEIREEVLKLIKYIKIRNEKSYIYAISSVSGLSDIKKTDDGYTSEKNHIQMQIALSWYNFIHRNNLQEEYKPPFEGQKMNYYYCMEGSGYKVIGIPDDVDIDTIKLLPQPDINRMINEVFIKPLLRYIYDKSKIEDKDIEQFLLGVKQWKF